MASRLQHLRPGRLLPFQRIVNLPISGTSTSSPLLRLPTKVAATFVLSPRSSAFFARPMASMSTPPPGKFEWLVIVPDKPGMQDKRLEVRAQHLEGTKPLAESGFVKTGGALLNDKPEGDDASKFSFYGSTLVCVASSKEEILELLNKDIYARSGVWDMENIQIWPAKFAFRHP